MNLTARPRRSMLYMPASNLRALEKAKSLPCDGIIFDLEDAVAPEHKPAARSAARSAVASRAYGRRELLIRVNGLATPWAAEDLAAVATSGADGVVLPKVNSVQDVQDAVRTLARAGAPAELQLWAMIETPRGVLAATEIAHVNAALPQLRLAGLITGTADLAKELRCAHPADRAPMMYALQLCVLAARAAGVAVLDGVHFDLEDEEGYAAACRQGRDLGFDGKTLIHPRQIPLANATFAPAASAIEQAKRIIAAHQAAHAQGSGVTLLDGRLLEQLHVEEAQRVLQEAALLAALEAQS